MQNWWEGWPALGVGGWGMKEGVLARWEQLGGVPGMGSEP